MKLTMKEPLSRLWEDAKAHYNPEEILKFLHSNRHILKKHIARLDNRKYLYRMAHWLFSLFSAAAWIADTALMLFHKFLALFPGRKIIVQRFLNLKNHVKFRESVEFMRAKIFALRRPPHNEGDLRLIEEMIQFASKHGFDYKNLIPGAQKKFLAMKHQLLQHKFFQEFSKSAVEKLLATQFLFHRNIFPVLPDSAFWHKLFEFLERKVVVDIILMNMNRQRTSFKHGSREEIASTDVIKILTRLAEIKKHGRRIFFIGHHEGYLGPYFVRSVIRKLGFDILTKNCNTVVGPRMFSNVVLRSGAANAGNLFVTVPSQKTTPIRTDGLADELRKVAKRTQCLIKMPDAGLQLIRNLDYTNFMNAFVYGSREAMEFYTSSLTPREVSDLNDFFMNYNFREAMKDFSIEDYNLFRQIMGESFLIFPEGSRSYTDHDGAVVMKYFNPKYFEAYMRPGDFIAPVNLVGGSDLARGWRLRKAVVGISMDYPFEVTRKMLKNFEEAGIAVMKKIAGLPNIKDVRFKEEIQFRNKTGENTKA
ncbi:MAG TPA: hypothetical protein PK544_11615 [Spirochaetota bacterium]|nr:hypothetical protein [Spirochaetota bacterium]HPJ37940.1 hypothetical protein [Spirochaetota bacterium]